MLLIDRLMPLIIIRKGCAETRWTRGQTLPNTNSRKKRKAAIALSRIDISFMLVFVAKGSDFKGDLCISSFLFSEIVG